MFHHRILRRISMAAALIVSAVASSAPALAQDSCDPSINHMRAGIEFYETGSYQAAYASFTCFLTLYPADAYPQQTAEALNMRGNALRALGDWQGAIAQYLLAVEAQEDFAVAYSNRGWAQFNLGDYDAALADYNAAITYDPDLAYAYNNRGLVYQFRGDLRAAASDFERAISLGLEAANWARYNLDLVDWVESRQGNTLAPASAGSTSHTLAEVEALLAAGVSAHDQGNWRETVILMSQVLERDANAAAARYLRGRAYMSLDNPDAAFADFDRLVTLLPDFEYAYWERAVASGELGDFEQAQADAQRAAMMNPGHINNFITRGTLASLQGDGERAGQEFLGMMLVNERERIAQAGTIGTTIRLNMTEGRIYELRFTAEAGQVIDIMAASTDADAAIALLGPDGTPLNGDDDSGFMLNALIEGNQIEVSGVYTLMVSHAGGGSEGMIAVTIHEAGS